MKVIIAGSRTITDFSAVEKAVEKSGWRNEITEVISGCAKGVDKLGEMWARGNNIPIKSFPAEWNKYGKNAGPIRNRKMAEYSDCLIAVWNSISNGTRNMLEIMMFLEKPYFIYYVYKQKGGK